LKHDRINGRYNGKPVYDAAARFCDQRHIKYFSVSTNVARTYQTYKMELFTKIVVNGFKSTDLFFAKSSILDAGLNYASDYNTGIENEI